MLQDPLQRRHGPPDWNVMHFNRRRCWKCFILFCCSLLRSTMIVVSEMDFIQIAARFRWMLWSCYWSETDSEIPKMFICINQIWLIFLRWVLILFFMIMNEFLFTWQNQSFTFYCWFNSRTKRLVPTGKQIISFSTKFLKIFIDHCSWIGLFHRNALLLHISMKLY